MSLKKNVEKQVRSENESKGNFFAWRSSERFLFTLSFPFAVEPTSTSFKNTVIKKGRKFSGKGEESDFDLGNPDGEGKGKEVR